MSIFNILRWPGGFVLPALCRGESGPDALWGAVRRRVEKDEL
jgi:hypothetical protein